MRRAATLRYLRQFGLGLLEWRIIARLDERVPASLSALAEEIGIDKAQMSRGVTALVGRGLVLREVNPRNRREIRLLLTAKGRAIHRRMVAGAHRRGAEMTAGLSAAQRADLEYSIDHMLASARAMLAREQAGGDGAAA